jgi:hypothetical protein
VYRFFAMFQVSFVPGLNKVIQRRGDFGFRFGVNGAGQYQRNNKN